MSRAPVRALFVEGLPGTGRCLEHWCRFASESRGARALPILEGSAFQSTIRFMLERDAPRDEILGYLRDFERSVAPLAPRLVYLDAPDPRAFLSDG